MANPLDYINLTSATQAVNKATASASDLAGTFQQGIGQVAGGVSGVATDLAKSGLSVVNSIKGGISTVVDKFKSEFANFPKPPSAPLKTPQEMMVIERDIGPMSFPSDIGEYFASFSFFEYLRPTPNSKAEKKPTVSIALPIPANLKEEFNMQIDEIQIGNIANIIQDVMGGKEYTEETAIAAMKDAAKAAGFKGVESLVSGNKYGSDIMNAIQQSAGMTLNPHVGLLFKGVNLRAPHVFTYRFVPRDAAESVKIKNIIRELKIRMHPTTEGFTFNYPDLCDIQIHRPDGEDGRLYTFKSCFLESMRVNYAPNGVPTFFAGTREPTEIEIEMTFKEASIFTREDFQTEAERAANPKRLTNAGGSAGGGV